MYIHIYDIYKYVYTYTYVYIYKYINVCIPYRLKQQVLHFNITKLLTKLIKKKIILVVNLNLT